MEETVIEIKSRAEKLIQLIGGEAEAIIKKRGESYCVELASENPAWLIGRNGEGLDALQHLLRAMIEDKLDISSRSIVLDINGYREKKKGFLEKKAREVIFRVRTTGMEEVLPPMSSYERMVVHTLAGNFADVSTESRGVGRDRRIVIKPKY